MQRERGGAMSNATINNKTNSFSVAGLKHIFSIVNVKDGVHIDIASV